MWSYMVLCSHGQNESEPPPTPPPPPTIIMINGLCTAPTPRIRDASGFR